MQQVRSKRIEYAYFGVACVLVIIFILSFFWHNISSYFNNLKSEPVANEVQLATKVGDDIYFYSGYFADNTSLYKYNIKSKKLDRIHDMGIRNLRFYNGYLYYIDYDNYLYRYDVKNKKSLLILNNCSDFQINDNLIVFLNSEEQMLCMYDLKTKQTTNIGISCYKYLFIKNKIYYIHDQNKSIMEYDIENKQYKNYDNFKDIDLEKVNLLSYYRGYFYLNDYENTIVCYDKDFNFVWKIEGGYNFSIIGARIYFPNNKDNMNLYSINLKGKELRKENLNSCFVSGKLALYKDIDKQLIISIKDNKNYQIPKIEPVVLNTPTKKEIKTVTGYRMVKKDNKLYYPYLKGIFEHDIKTNQKNLILNDNYINDITSLKGNVATTDSILKYLDSDIKQFKPITNMMIKKVINFKDDIYLYSVNNFLYKLDLETSSIKKVFEDKIWIECYFGNKIYYSKIEGEVINRTLLNIYHLETEEKGTIEYKITGENPIHEIIYIDDNFIVFTSDDRLYKFDNRNKTTKQILKQIIYSIQDIVTTDKGILFLSPEGQKLYLLEFENCELKKIVDIFQTEGFINSYLYDNDEKKVYYLNMSLGGQIEEIRLK